MHRQRRHVHALKFHSERDRVTDEAALQEAAIAEVLQFASDIADLQNGPATSGTLALGTRSGRSTLACAADGADKVSLAGAAHALGVPDHGAAGFVTDALGGNAFSGAVHLVQSFGSSGMGGGHTVYSNMAQGVLAGPTLGLAPPGAGPVGITDLASQAIERGIGAAAPGGEITTLTGTVSTSALTAAEWATGLAWLKFGWDALSFAGAAALCATQVIQ